MKIDRSFARFISLLTVFTLVFAIPVFADEDPVTIPDVEVIETQDEEGNPCNRDLGDCDVVCTPGELSAEQHLDGGGTRQVQVSVGGVSSADVEVKRQANDFFVTTGLTNVKDVTGGTESELTPGDYQITNNSWVVSLIFDAIEGLPSSASGSLQTLFNDNGSWFARGSFMIPFFTNTASQTSEDRESSDDDKPAEESFKAQTESVQQQEEIRTELTQIAAALPLATPEIKAQIMEKGLNINMSKITTIDAQTVKALADNNTVPYNIFYTYKGNVFACRIPAGFDFKPFIKADGTINLSELLGYLIQQNAKTAAAR